MSVLLNINYGLTNCAGAEVHINQDGSYAVRVVKLSLAKQQVQIRVKKEYTGSALKISTDLIAEPLAITITGKGVLIKKTALLDVVSEHSLQHLFPALKLAEFYVQHFASGVWSYIAIIRKETADTVISAFKNQGSQVLMLSLGPFVVDQILPQINSYKGTILFDGHQLTLNDVKEWQEYSYSAGTKANFPLKVDIETIAEEFLLAYATAFQLILNDKLLLIEADAEEIKYRLAESSARLKFNKNGMFLLMMLFVLLVVNFLVFSIYNSSNKGLANRAGAQSDLVENRQNLAEEVNGKENLVKKLGWNKGYRFAYLCDQIGSTLPKEIVLDELLINPLTGTNIGLVKDAGLEVGTMKIKGQTSTVYAVNNWIYELKQKRWVDDVHLEKYAADDQKQTQVFTITLNY